MAAAVPGEAVGEAPKERPGGSGIGEPGEPDGAMGSRGAAASSMPLASSAAASLDSETLEIRRLAQVEGDLTGDAGGHARASRRALQAASGS